jgi:hypothetical protein
MLGNVALCLEGNQPTLKDFLTRGENGLLCLFRKLIPAAA